MKLYYLFAIICVITSAKSEAFAIRSVETPDTNIKSSSRVKRYKGYDCTENGVVIPTYGIYLIGFTMLIMFIAIICLSVALYLNILKRKVFGLTTNNSRQYVRQESTGIATLYNSNYDEHNKHDGSTLTVNSGIIEINRISEPETPTQLEDSRIMFTKRHIRPIVPIIHKGQMDEICKEVLKRKVQKSDSASFRDLNELLNMDKKSEQQLGTNYEPVKEEIKDVYKENETNQKIETKCELKKETEPDSKYEPKQETKCEPEKETKYEPKPEENSKTLTESNNEQNNSNNYVKIQGKDVVSVDGDINTEDSDTETEYDTVPNPVRFRHSGPMFDDFDIESIPVYDHLPPRRSFDGPSKNMVQIDQDTEYLLPLSATGNDSCYINAKRNSYHST